MSLCPLSLHLGHYQASRAPIGQDVSRDLNTGLWLAEIDLVPRSSDSLSSISGEHLSIRETISSGLPSVWQIGSPSGRRRGCDQILEPDLIFYWHGPSQTTIYHPSVAQHRNKMSLFKQGWNKRDMTGGQIDKQSWHDWNKRTVSWCIFLSF